MLTHINFSNFWPRSLDYNHSIWKNKEAQFSINQMLKDKIKKRILIIQKYSEQK